MLVVSLAAQTDAIPFDYNAERSKAVKACEAIDPSDSQSSLIFNPDGYRSYYVRSKCFQEAAVTFRDQVLCAEVKERRSLLSSSWGYTPERCRQLVVEGTAVDRAAIDRMKGAYTAGGIRLRDFRIERNGNGRDVDIVPAFSGTYAHAYTLTFEILLDTSGAPALLHRSGYFLDEKSNLRIYIPQADIKQQLPGFTLNRSYTVRTTVTLDVGFGGPSGYWSPAFIDGVFPAAQRSQSLTREATF